DQAEAIGAVPHHELDLAVRLERIGKVCEDPVPLHGDGLFGKARGDPFDHGGPGGATRIVAYCTVWERHLDHFNLLLSRHDWRKWALTTAIPSVSCPGRLADSEGSMAETERADRAARLIAVALVVAAACYMNFRFVLVHFSNGGDLLDAGWF